MTERSGSELPGAADELPGEPASPNLDPSLGGADVARRRFIRQFAGEVVRSAATVSGAAGALQRALNDAARGSLDPSGSPGTEPPPSGPATIDPRPRAAFHVEDRRLLVIDQSQLPNALVERSIVTSADAVRAIRESVLRGSPAIAQVAAYALALTAWSVSDMKAAYARQATIRFSADALVSANPSAAAVAWAVGRCLALAAEADTGAEDGSPAARAIEAEAQRIVAQAAADHRRLAAFGFDALPSPEDRPLQVLTHGSTGWLAGGQVGTALGVVDVAVERGQPVHVFVAESRPDLEGTRLAAWELAGAGVPHTVIADGAAGWLIATRGEVDAVIVGAETIAANGDTVARIGTYSLAVLAAQHGVPFYVCAPLCGVDLAAPDGAQVTIEQRPSADVTAVRGVPVAGPGTSALNPACDVTPAALITGIVTEEGVLRPKLGPALAAAVDARDTRWRVPIDDHPGVASRT
jgi:methylthioribose-1-phosphate isomerase